MSLRTHANAIARMSRLGFTLIELVMTLLVVAVLAAFAVSRMDFKSGFDERALHDRLKAGLQYARKAAVASRRYVCVSVTSGAGGTVSFTLENVVPESTAGTCSANLNLPSPDTTSGCAANQICAGSLSLSADNTSFRFDARGGSTAASTVTFASTGQPDISVEYETGYVH